MQGIQREAALLDFLNSTRVSSLDSPRDKNIVIFSANKAVKESFDELAEKNILSAPIYDDKEDKYIGMLDMMDYMSYILWVYGIGKGHGSVTLANISKDLVNYSGIDTFVPISEDDTLLKAIQAFQMKYVHRLPVMSKDGKKLVSLVSQSSIVQYLSKNSDIFGEIGRKSIQELHVGALGTMKPVISIEENSPLMEAFETLQKNKIYGCAVVDGDGTLIGNISVSDLKLSVEEHLEMLSFPIKNLFETYHRRELVTCRPGTSFIELLKSFGSGMHRIYVVDDFRKPVGVISLTDVLDLVHSLSKGYDLSWK